jgi:hypothetical protein
MGRDRFGNLASGVGFLTCLLNRIPGDVPSWPFAHKEPVLRDVVSIFGMEFRRILKLLSAVCESEQDRTDYLSATAGTPLLCRLIRPFPSAPGRRKPKAQGQCQQSRQPRAHSSALANFLAPDPALRVLIGLKPAYFLRAACWDDAGETLAVATRRRKLGLCSACFLSRSVTSSILSFSKPLRLAIMR